MFREPAIAIPAALVPRTRSSFASSVPQAWANLGIGTLALTASLHFTASSHAAVATLDAQAVIARDAFACHSPWQVIQRVGCRELPAGTEVNIVSADEFFACVVWSGTQRCMWIARDVLRKP